MAKRKVLTDKVIRGAAYAVAGVAAPVVILMRAARRRKAKARHAAEERARSAEVAKPGPRPAARKTPPSAAARTAFKAKMKVDLARSKARSAKGKSRTR